MRDVRIKKIIDYLSIRCDYANAIDGTGFNKIDAGIGHSLSELPFESWSDKQVYVAYKLIKKYRNQYSQVCEYESIVAPPEPPAIEKPAVIKKEEIEINHEGERVVRAKGKSWIVEFTYSKEMVSLVKETFQYRKYDPEKKCWIIPMRVDEKEIEEFISFVDKYEFEKDTSYYEKLNEIGEQLAERLINVQRSYADSADFEVQGLKKELRPFQKAGVEYVLRNERVIIGDDMGLGKTVQTIASIHAKDLYPTLVICPASLKLNWKREFESWVNRRSVFVINGKANSTAQYCDVVIINYDIVKKHKEFLSQIEFKSVVMDESHYVKNYKAQRTEAVKELAKKITFRIALSGTAILNRPAELISQLTILNRLSDFGGFAKFTQRYCNAFRDRFGLNISGATNLEELNEKLRMICYIRRTKSEVLKELPEKQRAIVPIELTNRAEYEKAEEDLILFLQEKALADKEFLDSIAHLSADEQELAKHERAMSVEEKTRRAEQLVRIEALKQCCIKGKLEGITEWIDNFLESGEKLVIFATHRDIINGLAKKYNAPKITGDTATEDRQQAVDDFQNDPEQKLIFLNIKAGGVGLTLTASSNVAFLELDWTPASMSQAEDRCHRIGQQNSVTAWYLLADQTIDDEIYTLLREKEKIVNGVLEGDGQEVNISIMKELLSKIMKRKNVK